MFSIFGNDFVRTCQGRTRREFLRVGSLGSAALGLGGMSLPWLMEQQAAAAAAEADSSLRDTSVVLLTLNGGPSQFETFDPKMNAPAEIRSATGEVKTTQPGITFGGTFPRLASIAHKFTTVRSFGTYNGDHNLAQLDAPLGRRAEGGGSELGASYARVAGAIRPGAEVPSYALVNSVVFDKKLNQMRAAEFTSTFLAASQPGHLGPGCAPFYPAGGGSLMNDMQLGLPTDRFGDRLALMAQLDRLRREVDASGVLDKADQFRARAYEVITRGMVKAFDLAGEDAAVLARYDTGEYHIEKSRSTQLDNYTPKHLGKQMLLARRLCESGCGFVMVDCFGWDMHGETIGDQFGMHEGFNALGWAVDKAVAAFIEDCEQRGLRKKIALFVTGEMGRTPRVNDRGGGRDHWGQIAPLLVYGGGLKMGQVIGQSDRHGGQPQTKPFDTDHLAATVMHVLLNGSQVRLRQDLPKDVVRLGSALEPIEGLV